MPKMSKYLISSQTSMSLPLLVFSVSKVCLTDIALRVYCFGQGGVNEGPSDPPVEPRKDLPAISPLHEKSFWMPALPTSWKIKRGGT